MKKRDDHSYDHSKRMMTMIQSPLMWNGLIKTAFRRLRCRLLISSANNEVKLRWRNVILKKQKANCSSSTDSSSRVASWWIDYMLACGRIRMPIPSIFRTVEFVDFYVSVKLGFSEFLSLLFINQFIKRNNTCEKNAERRCQRVKYHLHDTHGPIKKLK